MYQKLQCLISQKYYHKLIFKQNGNDIFKQHARYDLLQPPDNLSGNPSKFKAMRAIVSVEKETQEIHYRVSKMLENTKKVLYFFYLLKTRLTIGSISSIQKYFT